MEKSKSGDSLIDRFAGVILNSRRAERSNSTRAKTFEILHRTLVAHRDSHDCASALDALRDITPFSGDSDFRRQVRFALNCLPRTAAVEKTLHEELAAVALDRALERVGELLEQETQREELARLFLGAVREASEVEARAIDRQRRLDHATRRR